jgi:hypothetical protein
MINPVGAALQQIKTALDAFEVPFCAVGSYASSARGVPRGSFDIDLLTRLLRDLTQKFAGALGPEWMVDVEAIREALRWRRAFNIFNLPTGFKFAFFPEFDDFHTIQLERATPMNLAGGAVRCPVATAEDIVLAKLQWYRAGGEVSEKQWTDITGLLKAVTLNAAYLPQWASRLGVDELLSKALSQVHGDHGA